MVLIIDLLLGDDPVPLTGSMPTPKADGGVSEKREKNI
jgi:hypothetical protein